MIFDPRERAQAQAQGRRVYRNMFLAAAVATAMFVLLG